MQTFVIRHPVGPLGAFIKRSVYSGKVSHPILCMHAVRAFFRRILDVPESPYGTHVRYALK